MSEKDRIIELESKLAFLEASIETLSEEFYAQQKLLAKLQQEQRRLQHKLKAIEASTDHDAPNPVDEKPPHY